ncbi:hypothetical protein OEZ85_006279 [Tetradesmus obliquus]|uniref:Uncharacterized protein n=1 Tax=Tetradesmus obliquus TaxID=3088 RepID=A0ABY8TU37_TETOB|nr:hypothetical protein OEZ85_006279 [Tetradesmus obliquus]
MSLHQTLQTFFINPSSSGHGSFKYLLPFLLVSTVALWLLPGLLAKAAGRLLYCISRRVLKRASSSDVVLERGPAGYHLRNFTADAASLRLRGGPYEVTRLAVAEARLAWPTWQSVQLQARGLRVELLQRQMPQAAVPPPALSSSQQLDVLEQLLWQGESKPSRGQWSWVRQWLLKAVLGLVELQLEDVRYEAPAASGNTAASSQQKQNPVTQLSVTGVSIALMSSQPIPAAAAGAVPVPSTIGNCRPALAADLAACLLEEGWQQAHVVLKQWQCSIDVRSPSSRSASRPASTQAAEQAATVDQQLAAILMYKPAGVAEIDGGIVGNTARGELQPGVGKHSQYRLLSPVWSVRPAQPVSAAPAVWWQHASTVVLAECRRRCPPSSMRQALDRRRRYVSLYRAVHAQQAGYLPGGTGQAAAKVAASAAEKALEAAESTMAACEIATHRIFVALLHSRHLRRHPALRQQWLEALDGLGGFVDLIPGRGQGASRGEPGFAISLHCPTIAIKLASNQQPQTAQLVAELRGLQLTMPAAGSAAATVQQLQDSLISSYISKLQVQLGPMLVQLQPSLALQTLDYFKAMRDFDAAAGLSSSSDKTVPLKQVVLDSFKRHKVPLSFALATLLPLLDVSCPQLAVLAPLKHVPRLDGRPPEQQPHNTPVDLVARLQKLHASVGYNSSCYSSLLQQVDATADAEVFFVQRALTAAAAQQQAGHFAAVWLHPDDAAQLDTAQYAPTAAQSPARKSFLSSAPGPARSAAVRASVMGLFGAGHAAPSEPAVPPMLAVTQPFVPLMRLQRFWTRLSTHIPTEPAVLGREHTSAGCSAGGLLLWLSPWQVGAGGLKAAGA